MEFNRKSPEAVLLLAESQWINQQQPGHSVLDRTENE